MIGMIKRKKGGITMMPNKLYGWTGVLGSLYASPRKPEEINAEEYIRKDTLMEWAEAKKIELFDGEPTDVAAGINAGLDMIIQKLKSL